MTDYLEPNWARSALVVIDVQHDFVDAIPGTREILPELTRLIAAFRRARRPVVHVVRSYVAGSSDVDLVRRAAIEAGDAAVQPGTPGAQIPAELLPPGSVLDWDRLRAGSPQAVGPDEMVLYKPRWSAFHRTTLDGLLNAAGVDTVVVAGCNLPNCPRATLFDASERDYRTVLVADATSRTTSERLADLALIGVRVRDTGEALAGLAEI